jgi:hypothetical protein
VVGEQVEAAVIGAERGAVEIVVEAVGGVEGTLVGSSILIKATFVC